MEKPTSEQDWSRWLPPKHTPSVDGRERDTFKVGQVWACRGDDTHNAVWRVVVAAQDRRPTRILFLASEYKNSVGQTSDMDSYSWFRRAVLVQDVGQPEPTPPEILYAPSPAPASPVPVWEVGQRRRGMIYADHNRSPENNPTCHDGKPDEYTLVRRIGNGAWATDLWLVNESWPSELLSPATPVQPTAAFEPPGIGREIEAPPADHYEVSVARPAVTAPVARRWEVSQDGKHWVDFDRMTDADPFESYKHRRVDGVRLEVPEPRGYDGETWAAYVQEENDVATGMSFTNLGLPPERIVEDKSLQAQSFVHDRGCLGIWNTRGR